MYQDLVKSCLTENIDKPISLFFLYQEIGIVNPHLSIYSIKSSLSMAKYRMSPSGAHSGKEMQQAFLWAVPYL